ncbi:MAG TPA: DUF4301 domain-containing protein [Bacteroidales bacterium]|nr:MAG: hypothetical protein A2X11_14805 [Bacteroidetes bacterium GWE2_42_24]OFY31734.1 MAG: hypothetical protein A2X09_08545 [Bacteroidetes bacterium GWF2_43_11]HAQ64426.1 DUF4301 domain-containing protein [Bacteroidales bacterium]HBZ67124.1 DUF4301 domain-containing protein [Bacteroidales bacterium]
MLLEKDLAQLRKKGITPETVANQITQFTSGFPFVKLTAPATIGHGMLQLSSDEVEMLRGQYYRHSINHQLLKFVPASGAASRMFKQLFEFVEVWKSTDEEMAMRANKKWRPAFDFIDQIGRFAFYDELRQLMSKNSDSPEKCIERKDYATLIGFVLQSHGLDYAARPKALIRFHRYPEYNRLALEEHLVEGANYCRQPDGTANLHFTVSPEHRDLFVDATKQTAARYEKLFGVKYNITFSEQSPSTDTIAVNPDNTPFREKDGSLLFRPGGHGALLKNLNDLQGDIIFIKNIDNIVPDRLKPVTYQYKEVIGGLLLWMQEEIHFWLKRFHVEEETTEADLATAADFAVRKLFISLPTDFAVLPLIQQKEILIRAFNRPLRVCGMVKNEGEPGGGPFILDDGEGRQSLQVVESSQIDLKNPEQKAIFDLATHFNPVDLVCAVRDWQGNPFDLSDFIDEKTGFISEKSKDGKDLKALELPGLWNGAMANWITLFVEVPIITFNPVKTINDLLREQHQ